MDDTRHTPHDQRDVTWWRRLARKFFKPISAGVVIVDPDPDFAVTLKQSLGNAYQVSVALSATAALPLLAASPPDILVCELDLPDMDGLAFVRTVKGQPALARAAVLVLSARSTINDKISAFRLGVDDYMVKPVTALEVRNHVEALVRFRQALAAGSAGSTGSTNLA